jgi:hypothetical protein
MPEPIQSDGWLLDPIRTQMFVGDEDDLQVLVADVDHWTLHAYEDAAELAFYSLLGQPPASLMFDVLKAWKLGPPGCNAEHWLYYGENGWLPKANTVTRLEYIIYRKPLGPGLPQRPLVYVHLRHHSGTRTLTL